MTQHEIWDFGGRVDHDWTRLAACRDQSPQTFTDPRNPADLHRALAPCTTCPVRRPCLETALTHPVEADVGIWGGTTEETRRHIRHGELTIDHALATRGRSLSQALSATRPGLSPDPALAAKVASATNVPPRQRSAVERRLPAPEITVARDRYGDYTDATGRVIIFRIHGDPPWMLMIDRRCIERTHTLTQARQAAWTALHPPQRATSHAPRRA